LAWYEGSHGIVKQIIRSVDASLDKIKYSFVGFFQIESFCGHFNELFVKFMIKKNKIQRKRIKIKKRISKHSQSKIYAKSHFS